jgi:hypothetical protein
MLRTPWVTNEALHRLSVSILESIMAAGNSMFVTAKPNVFVSHVV